MAQTQTPKTRFARPRRRADLLSLTPDQFEELIAVLYKYLGYETRIRGGSGDGGVDVEAYKNGKYYIIQCKLYTGTIGSNLIRELAGAKTIEGADGAILATTGSPSKAARETAHASGIKLATTPVILDLFNQAEARYNGYASAGPSLYSQFTNPARRKRLLKMLGSIVLILLQIVVAIALI